MYDYGYSTYRGCPGDTWNPAPAKMPNVPLGPVQRMAPGRSQVGGMHPHGVHAADQTELRKSLPFENGRGIESHLPVKRDVGARASAATS